MAPGLCCIVQAQAAVTFGLQSSSGGPLAQLTPATGSLRLFELYTEANDIPVQREALLTLYNATAGQNWTAGVFQNTVFLQQTALFRYATQNITGKSDASRASIKHQACCLGLANDTSMACRYCPRALPCFHQRHAAQGSMAHAWLQLLSMVGSAVLPDSIRGFIPLLHGGPAVHWSACTCRSAHPRLHHCRDQDTSAEFVLQLALTCISSRSSKPLSAQHGVSGGGILLCSRSLLQATVHACFTHCIGLISKASQHCSRYNTETLGLCM